MVERVEPQATQEMSQTPASAPASHPAHTEPQAKPAPNLIHDYSSAAAKEAGKKTVDYVAQSQDTTQVINNAEAQAEQKYGEAKAEAQGIWAKLFGCFSAVE
ncbi:hypothetical protein HWV62_6847 [Athelia sp. TMB]|nr:hypothetical protein HWV62_6847 [Athelia sp. TMB]